MKNFWIFDIFYPKIFNFLSKISLKFSNFLEGWNIDQRLTRCWTFISRARTPSICTQKAQTPNFRIWSYFSIFGKKYFASNVPYVCRYLACARGIWKFNIWRVFDRYFIPPKNSKILVRFYLRNWRFLDKKCQNFKNFSLAQYDPISLLNPWNRFKMQLVLNNLGKYVVPNPQVEPIKGMEKPE